MSVFVPRVPAAHVRRAVARSVEVVQDEVGEMSVELRVDEALDARRVLGVCAWVARRLLAFGRRRYEAPLTRSRLVRPTTRICINTGT